MRLAVVMVAALVPTAAAADCAGAYSSGGQPALLECLRLQYSGTDERLNEIWPRVMAEHPSGGVREEHRKDIVAAQRAWIAFRDADCEARSKVGIPKYWESNRLSCLVEMTSQRIELLTTTYLD